jgi:hypothetical protein
MPRASERQWRVLIQRVSTAVESEHGDQISGAVATLATRYAKIRFGTAQEKREAAQEKGVQSATFEFVRSAVLDAVVLSDRISFDGSFWDITEKAPLDRKTIRFTATRNV